MCGSAKKSTIDSITAGPMPVDAAERFGGVGAARGAAQRGEIGEMAREPARVGLADVADAERVEEAVEGDAPPRLDRGEQIARRDFAEAFPFAQAAAGPGRRARRG